MHVYIRITYNTLIKLNRTIYCCICLNNKELAKWRCYCQDCQHKKLTSSKLYFKFSNCCCMLDYLSLKYRCSSNKFHFLLWVEIDRNIFKIQHYELHLQLLCTVCHKTRVKPSYICKSSPKSIGSSGRFPFAASFVHHFGLKKTGF